MRQHDGIGQPVRRVIPPTKLVCNGVHIAHIGAGERQASVGGGQQHFFACLQVGALAARGAQVLENQAHG